MQALSPLHLQTNTFVSGHSPAMYTMILLARSLSCEVEAMTLGPRTLETLLLDSKKNRQSADAKEAKEPANRPPNPSTKATFAFDRKNSTDEKKN